MGKCRPNSSLCGMKDGLFNPFFTGNYSNPYAYSGSSVEAGTSDITIDDTTYTFTANQAQMVQGYSQLYTPKILYDNGKTYAVYQKNNIGRLVVLKYDDRYGLGNPIGVRMQIASGFDTHHEPVIFSDANKLYMLQEKNHNSEPIGILKARNVGDDLLWQVGTNTIGTIPTYPILTKKNGVFLIAHQFSDVSAGLVYNTGSDIDGTWESTSVQLTVRAADEDEHYVSGVMNYDAVTDEMVIVINGRNDDGSISYFRKYLLRVKVTAPSTVTIYNWDKSFSKNSALSSAELIANCEYYDTGSDLIVSNQSNAALDNSGNFYDSISNDAGSTLKFIILLSGQASTAPTVKDAPHFFYRIMPISTSLIYAIANQTVGAFSKPFLFKTTDLGDNWEEVSEIFEDIDADVVDVGFPANHKDIPNDSNFIFCGRGTGGALHVKKAAFGTLQSETPANFYGDTVAYSEAEYNALMDFSYMIEAGKITTTGTTLTAVADQSPNARNPGIGGSPVVDNGTTPSYLVFDGTNDLLGITADAGLLARSEGIVLAVIKPTNGGSAFFGKPFITATNDANTTSYITFGASFNNVISHAGSWGTPKVEVYGDTTLTDDFHIVAFYLQNGGCDVLGIVDGKFQLRNEVQQSVNEGKFLSGVNLGMEFLRIGALTRSSGTTYFSFQLKHIAICSAPQTEASLAKMIKFLSTKYGISLTSHYK